jgi:hypothetical protein
MARVSVVGPVEMGGEIGQSLLRARFEVVVYHGHPGATVPLVETGASGGGTAGRTHGAGFDRVEECRRQGSATTPCWSRLGDGARSTASTET